MDSTTQIVPRDSEIINELLSHVTNGFEAHTFHKDAEIINELLSNLTHVFDSAHVP
jgi:hypothetical protein